MIAFFPELYEDELAYSCSPVITQNQGICH